MTTQHGPKLEPTTVPKHSDYHVHSKTEIVSILKEIQEKREVAALFFADNQSMLTSVLKVSGAKDRIYLDCNINEQLNRQVESSRRLIFVSAVRSIKIQFDIPHIERVQFDDGPAFLAALPKSIVRLQRREYFRIDIPNTETVVCTIPTPNGNIEAVIVNISAGGAGVMMSYGEGLTQGESYPDCKITLPGLGELTTTIEVKSTFDVTMKNDVVKTMAGCEFIGMREQAKNLAQRYIMKTERDRRAQEQDD